jgi:hypothetical protein
VIRAELKWDTSRKQVTYDGSTKILRTEFAFTNKGKATARAATARRVRMAATSFIAASMSEGLDYASDSTLVSRRAKFKCSPGGSRFRARPSFRPPRVPGDRVLLYFTWHSLSNESR